MSLGAVVITLFSIVLALLLALLMIPVLVWLERRVAGLIQDRKGPNRTNVLGFRLGGVVQSFADVIKLVFKEEYYPKHIGKHEWLFIVAPSILFVCALLGFMVIPFADNLQLGTQSYPIQALPVDWGILWYLSIGSIGVMGVLFGGWVSHNKYALLGSQRATSLMLGYELPMGLSIVAMIITYQTIDFNTMVAWQSDTIWGFLPAWGIVVQPLATFIFIVTLFVETNRAPFNVAEGESEIVAGHMTEFSAMKFALYFMGEYIAMNSASAVIITLFFGGYQLPYLSTNDLFSHFDAIAIVLMLFLPIFIYYFIRWMHKNNAVNRTLSSDGGRAFETKVLTYTLIAMSLMIELVMVYLIMQPKESLAVGLGVMALQIAIFIAKLMLFNIFFIVVRWTLPRFRYDQVQKLGWNYLLPLALVNIFVTAIVVVALGA
ncbi:MAG: NADH-quinone oxidoreductase subunit H [Sulfurovum sp. FS08-3]|nr:MAG: NADH-quinone oxidoreductase subunit H [Sulfurovum sp. FS08-3]